MSMTMRSATTRATSTRSSLVPPPRSPPPRPPPPHHPTKPPVPPPHHPTTTTTPATSTRSSLVPARPAAVRSVVLRAVESPESKETASTSEPAVAAAPSGAAPSVQSFAILNPVTEAINGRAAMLGFVAAVASEAVTHQAVWSQIVGRYINLELVESPIGAAPLGFAAVVALITMASLAPKMLAGDNVDSKSFGPFTPGLELTLGRVAQMGFLGLVVVELFKGSALL